MKIPRNISSIPSPVFTVIISVFVMLYALAMPFILMLGGK